MGTYWILNTFVPILQLFILVISLLYFFNSRWFRGFAWKMRVHILTKIHLDKTKYHILKNVTLPDGDGKIQIDNIIVSEYGVFVIETINMRGWIFGDTIQKTWTQKIFKYTLKFQNPLHLNYKRVEILKSILELTDQQIFSIVVFVGNCFFKTEMPDDVINGPRLLKYIKSKDQQVILSTDVPMILSKIESERLRPSRKRIKSYIEHVKRTLEERQNGKPFLKYKSTSALPVEDEVVGIGIEEEPVFSDSWGNKTWRDDDIQPAIADRAFR